MKKKVFGRKLSRERDTRKALFRSLVYALLKHGKIKTTKAKAKAVQPLIDRLISIAKEGSVASSRRVYALLGNNKEAVRELSRVVAPTFSDRKGGYTRIVNLGVRRGDSAQMVRLEWVEEVKEAPKAKKSVKSVKNQAKSEK